MAARVDHQRADLGAGGLEPDHRDLCDVAVGLGVVQGTESSPHSAPAGMRSGSAGWQSAHCTRVPGRGAPITARPSTTLLQLATSSTAIADQRTPIQRPAAGEGRRSLSLSYLSSVLV